MISVLHLKSINMHIQFIFEFFVYYNISIILFRFDHMVWELYIPKTKFGGIITLTIPCSLGLEKNWLDSQYLCYWCAEIILVIVFSVCVFCRCGCGIEVHAGAGVVPRFRDFNQLHLGHLPQHGSSSTGPPGNLWMIVCVCVCVWERVCVSMHWKGFCWHEGDFVYSGCRYVFAVGGRLVFRGSLGGS